MALSPISGPASTASGGVIAADARQAWALSDSDDSEAPAAALSIPAPPAAGGPATPSGTTTAAADLRLEHAPFPRAPLAAAAETAAGRVQLPSPLSSDDEEEDEPPLSARSAEAAATQQQPRTVEATAADGDPELQAVLLPSLCSCLRSELGLPEEGSDAATIDRACDMVGLPQAGTPVRRARACLVALGV